MKIILEPWIATRTYYIKNVPISYIRNSKTGVYYILKGAISALWDVISNSNNFDEIYSYAEKNNQKDILFDFLSELQSKSFINTDIKLPKSNTNYMSYAMSEKSKNLSYFINKWLEYTHGLFNFLQLELNYKCNLNCKHCYNHKDMNQYFISFEQAKKIIDEAYDLGINVVIITGGECTINKDFLKILQYIKEKHLEFHFLTNCQKFYDDDNLLNEVMKLYPARIKTSVYSMRPEIHDYITGVPGSLHKTLKVVDKLKENGLNVIIATPVLSVNADCYQEVKDYALSKGIRINLSIRFINNKKNNNISFKPKFEDIEKFYINNINLDHLRIFENDNNAICEAGFDRICVNPKLDVIPCIGVDYVFGNLNSVSLKEIKETTYKEFQKKFVKANLTDCFKYDYCRYCFYCLDNPCFVGKFMKKDELYCEDAKAYYNAVNYYKEKGMC